jgi:hypothetical protein
MFGSTLHQAFEHDIVRRGSIWRIQELGFKLLFAMVYSRVMSEGLQAPLSSSLNINASQLIDLDKIWRAIQIRLLGWFIQDFLW